MLLGGGNNLIKPTEEGYVDNYGAMSLVQWEGLQGMSQDQRGRCKNEVF